MEFVLKSLEQLEKHLRKNAVLKIQTKLKLIFSSFIDYIFFFLSFLMHFKWFYVSFAFSILRMTGKRSSLRCYFLHLLLQVTHGASLAPEPEILHPPFAADIVKQLLLLAHLLGILVNLLLSMTLNHDILKKHILNHDRLRYFQMDTKIWLRLGWIRNF